MGMFNSIYTDIWCPVKNKIAKNVEIQIKWQKYEARTLSVYHLGDQLEDIEEEYENTWIRTDYICPVCSEESTEHFGRSAGMEDLKWHIAFVHIVHSRIEKIISEQEFKKLGVKNFFNDVFE